MAEIKSIWETVNLSEHIRKQYQFIHKLNMDEVEIIRRANLEGGNFFNEDLLEGEVFYKIQMNINPVKAKGWKLDEKALVKDYRYEVYTDPQYYPDRGYDSNGNEVEVKFDKILRTDKVRYEGVIYEVEELEDVALNRKPMLWQRFFLKIIN